MESIQIKSRFVVIDINDEENHKIGELKFNPNDSLIMKKMSKILEDLSTALEKLEAIGDIPNIKEDDLKNIDGFRKNIDTFKKINSGYNIEYEAVEGCINDLIEIFGKETIDLFTGGTMDIQALKPLLDCIEPYVKKARNQKVNKYINNQSDVFE